MRKPGYDDTTKEAILKAAAGARRAGRKWKDAHKAAIKAGYKGSVGGLVQLVRGSKAGLPKRKLRVSRKRMRNETAPAPAPLASHSNGIAALIDNLVETRVNSAIDEAIATLRMCRG